MYGILKVFVLLCSAFVCCGESGEMCERDDGTKLPFGEIHLRSNSMAVCTNANKGEDSRQLVVDSGKLLNFLFVGNSFTFVNDLPNTFAKMARSGGYNANAYFSGVGSATFQTHYLNPNLPLFVNLFHWDAIIMQEQSMFLSQPPSVYKQNSVPWAMKLYEMFRNSTDKVILYETWGYKNGNPSAMTGLDDDYYKMQERLWGGYNYTLDTLTNVRAGKGAIVEMSPVGQAWKVAQKKMGSKMWQQDGMHPKPNGSYLAACVFYAKYFQRSPVGNKYIPKGVSDAKVIQTIAANTVLQKK